MVVSRKVTTRPPYSPLHWKDIIAAALESGGAGWTQRDMENTARPSRTGQVGGCPSRGSKAVTCGLGFLVSSTRSVQDIHYPPALVPLRWGSEKSPSRAQ